MKRYTYVFFVLSLFLFGCTGQYATTPSADDGASGSAASESGRTVFTVTDAAADMGTVSSIKVTVDSVRAHSEAQGWVTVRNEPATFDLLQLKASGNQALLADVQLKEGSYDQVRLDISEVVVTDAQGEHDAKLPSGELKIVGDLQVNAQSTSTASFDFIADESLHLTGEGKYILAPVVQFQTKEKVVVDVTSASDVKIQGGTTRTNVKVGMDAEGRVGVGLGIPASVNISIEGGRIRVGSQVGVGIGNRAEEDSDAAAASADAGVEAGISY